MLSTFCAQTNASIGIGFAIGGSQNGWTLELGANKGRGKADGTDTTWTNTHVQAGDSGFQVNVQGNTDLKGAVIASSEKAVQDGKNTFATGGTLTLSDIENRASFDADAYSVTLSGSTKLGDQTSEAAQKTMSKADKAAAATKTSGLSPSALSGAGVGSDDGSASSTTLAGISGIAGNTSVRTGDAETGITKIFDAGKVQKEINAQVQITQAFAQQASKEVGDYAIAQRTALYEKLKAAPTEKEQNEIKEIIKDVNLQERVMNVLVGAVTGNGASALTKESLSAAT